MSHRSPARPPLSRRAVARRLGAFALVLAGLAGLVLGQGRAQEAVDGRMPPVAVIPIEGPIGPATADRVAQGLEEAVETGAPAVVLRLDTPGGLVTATRTIIRDLLAAPIPVIGWVGPQGAHAASAGTYILYATHVAAMAPGTNVGAATPISLGGDGGLPSLPDGGEEGPAEDGGGDDTGGDGAGEDGAGETAPRAPQGAAGAKAVEDAVAWIRSLAELRGRNADWAERAVREAASLSAEGAVENGVADLMAADLQAVLEAADGRTVTLHGRTVTLDTAERAVVELDPGWRIALLEVITDPNIAFLLMLVGVYGLIFEFANPGTIGPGVIGAVCLVLGLYALSVLPLNGAGLVLILLGIAFMTAEAFVPSFGLLGIGGAVAFAFGAAILFETDSPAFRIDWVTIAVAAAASAGLLVFLLGYVWRAHRRPVTTGAEELAHAHGIVDDWSGGTGHVRLHGERWRARGAEALAPGRRVRVAGQDGLTLTVVADDAPSEIPVPDPEEQST